MTKLVEAAPDEQVTYRARLHWMLFAPPVAMFAAGLVSAFFQPPAAIALLLFSIVAIAAAYMKFSTTEIVITDRRVIYKTGLLARKTVEMNKDKIESIDVSESIFGRLFDFGAVTVKGTGGGLEAIQNVAAPFELRSHIASEGAEPSSLPPFSDPLRP
jgi:uncharacterized membrane protein YdbT with pleckstrin-like domain